MTESRGLKRACLYALPPHKKGLCGPKKKRVSLLQDFIMDEYSNEMCVRDILRQFQALNMYCKEIAKANGIKDPFAEQVINAYFIGNALLDKFFSGNYKRIPYHACHVLEIGSITERTIFDDRMRNLCIISFGKVITTPENKTVFIDWQPLKRNGQKMIFDVTKTIEVERDPKLVPALVQGNLVSLHWGKVIEVLTEEEVERLKKYTQKTLEFLN